MYYNNQYTYIREVSNISCIRSFSTPPPLFVSNYRKGAPEMATYQRRFHVFHNVQYILVGLNYNLI